MCLGSCDQSASRAIRIWTKLQIPMAAAAFLIGAPFGLAAFLWLGPLRLTWALHQQGFVNSVCHMRKIEQPGQQSAKNVVWLSVFHAFQGENWHQNHHDRPGSARLGFQPGQLDVGWLAIVALEKLGLAKDVRRPDLRERVDAAA